MRHIFLILSSILFTGAAFADAPCPCLCDPLMEIMVEEPALSKANIQWGGKPISAYNTEVLSREEIIHRGNYVNGFVVTYLSDNFDVNPYGSQIVIFIDVKKFLRGLPDEESKSTSWKIESFNGKRYVVHFHDGFCVYTAKDEQFVIAK